MTPTTNSATWTTARTWSTGELVTASIMNTHVRDNLNALKTPSGGYSLINQGADYTTSSTSFADIDATNLILTFTTNGGDVMVFFVGNVTNSNAGARQYFDIFESVANTRYGGDDGLLCVPSAGSTVANPFCLAVRIPSLTAASHSFKVQWKVSAGTATLYAGAGTANFDTHPAMSAFEL